MTTPVPPGWYPDPGGAPHQRWWDGSQWTSATNAPQTQSQQHTPPPPSRKQFEKGVNWKWAGGVVAVIVVIGFAASFSDDDSPRSSTSAASTSTQRAASTAAPRTSTAAEISAAADRAQAARDAAAAQEAARLDRNAYSAIDDRDFALLAKDPDKYAGRKFIVYGDVTQFDSATGTDTFRANTAAAPQQYSFDYDVNTVINGHDSAVTADVVEDDLVTMYVEVEGSRTYDTQLGGSTTVPEFTAHIIDVTGSSG